MNSVRRGLRFWVQQFGEFFDQAHAVDFVAARAGLRAAARLWSSFAQTQHTRRECRLQLRKKKRPGCPGRHAMIFWHSQKSHAPITRRAFAATLVVHRRRAMRSFLAPVKRRSKVRTTVSWSWSVPAFSATHALLRRLMHGPLKVAGAFTTMFPTALLPKLLRAGAAMMLEAGRRTAWATKSRVSTRTAEFLRLLPTPKTLAPATPHPALRAAAAMHLPALRVTLR
jgi:hypothetical protein